MRGGAADIEPPEKLNALGNERLDPIVQVLEDAPSISNAQMIERQLT